MNKEIEAKFINIDKRKIIDKLLKLGAVNIFEERNYRRSIFMFSTGESNKWVRVRDEVDKVTLAYKHVGEQSLSGVEEVELIIDDYNKGVAFLKSIQLVEKTYQESRRIRFAIQSEGVEFDIDTWPGLEPLLEIEAKNEENVRKYAKLLGFNWEYAMFGSVDFVYEKIFNLPEGWLFNDCPRLEFNNLPIELSK